MSRIDFEEKITAIVTDASRRLVSSVSGNDGADIPVRMDVPKDRAHGDLTTNAALRLSKIVKMNPVVCGEKLREFILEKLTEDGIIGLVAGIDVVKPGFLNFRLSDKFLHMALSEALKNGTEYGRSAGRSRQKALIEFVSANPTGPLTVAHGRQAAVGDALARIMRFCGYDVTEEYFINDEGRQIELLGRSIAYHYLEAFGRRIDFPEDGYRGHYIGEIAGRIREKDGDTHVAAYPGNLAFFSDYGVKYLMALIKKDLDDFAVRFDSWFSQRNLTPDHIRQVLRGLEGQGYVYRQDGAEWLKSTTFGDEKDRVVVKSDGNFTYLAPDILYHKEKYERGYDRLINLWGPDHHGYIPRIKAAVRALGHDPDTLSVLIVQLATLYRGGKAMSMSTRKGEFLTLREVMDDVGRDVAKFIFLMRKLDSHLDFDIDIAKRQSTDNPVYYIQYAHARIWSIMEYGEKMKASRASGAADPGLLRTGEEIDLMRLVSQFPSAVLGSAVNLEPYYVIVYLNDLATVFHNFYTKHRVVTDDPELTGARLMLVDCVRICLANGLELLGVSLPKKM
ncbi:MAG: arginine--tRNA ligase [Candidatus Omnitrophota bacterium]